MKDGEDDRSGKVHVLPGGNIGPTPELIERARREQPLLFEFYMIDAQNRWARYKALRDAGFSDDQAMHLVAHL